MEEVMKLASAQDPVFLSFLSRIAESRDEKHRLIEEGYAEEMFRLLPESVRRKQAKTQLTRCGCSVWFQNPKIVF
eukprot:876211-Amphidinium_carterae.1